MKLSGNEYRILTEQAPIMVWRANLSTECDYFNERWLQFTGRTMEQEVGNGWAQGVHKEDFDRCLKTYLDAFGKREVFEMRYRLRRHDGQYRWILDRGVPFHNDDGSFGGFIGSCIDINEQVVAEEHLRQKREAELEQLRGLLPICSYCKKIRDDQGQWRPLDEYVKIHSRTSFTHGVCGSCKNVHMT